MRKRFRKITAFVLAMSMVIAGSTGAYAGEVIHEEAAPSVETASDNTPEIIVEDPAESVIEDDLPEIIVENPTEESISVDDLPAVSYDEAPEEKYESLSGDVALKNHEITAEIEGMTVSVSGNLPLSADLVVTELDKGAYEGEIGDFVTSLYGNENIPAEEPTGAYNGITDGRIYENREYPDGQNIYRVAFVDHDGTYISKQYIPEGESAIAPVMPETIKDGSLKFYGWSRDYSNVREDIETVAIYAEENYELRCDVNTLKSVDIKILVDGREYEPETFGESVQVSFEYDPQTLSEIGKADGSELKVYHIEDDGQVEDVPITRDEAGISFETDSFSPYNTTLITPTVATSSTPASTGTYEKHSKSLNAGVWQTTVTETGTEIVWNIGKTTPSDAKAVLWLPEGGDPGTLYIYGTGDIDRYYVANGAITAGYVPVWYAYRNDIGTVRFNQKYKETESESHIDQGYETTSLAVTAVPYLFSQLPATRAVNIFGNALDTCTNLAFAFSGSGFESVYIPGNLRNVVTMHGTFYDMPALTQTNLAYANSLVSNTSLDCTWQNCPNFNFTYLSGLDTSAVTGMFATFENDTSLSYFTPSTGAWTTSTVTEMRRMFNGCSGLTNFHLESFSTAAITNTDNADGSVDYGLGKFAYGCSNASSLYFSSNFDFSKCPAAGETNGAFYVAPSTGTLYTDDGKLTTAVYVDGAAFFPRYDWVTDNRIGDGQRYYLTVKPKKFTKSTMPDGTYIFDSIYDNEYELTLSVNLPGYLPVPDDPVCDEDYYRFLFWSTDPEATDGASAFDFDTPYDGSEGDITLYAHYEYSVGYTSNYGDGDYFDPNFYKPGDTVTLLGQGTVSYEGLRLTGWTTRDGRYGRTKQPNYYAPYSSSGSSYTANYGTAGNTFVFGAGYGQYPVPVCLTAVWGSKVTYMANNGTSQNYIRTVENEYPVNANEKVYLSTYSWLADNYGFTLPAGQSFSHWNTAPDGSGESLDPGDHPAADVGNKTFYAIYEYSTPATLSYDKNDGSGIISSVITVVGRELSLKDETDVTRNGYTLAGWADSSTATTPDYLPGADYTITAASTTLYAVWQENFDYTIRIPASVSLSYDGALSTETKTVYSKDIEVDVEIVSLPKALRLNFATGGSLKDGTKTLPFNINSSSSGVTTAANKKSAYATIPAFTTTDKLYTLTLTAEPTEEGSYSGGKVTVSTSTN